MKHTFTHFFKALLLLLMFMVFERESRAQCYTLPAYCTATTTNINNYGIGLQNVTLGSTINNNTSATGNAPNYFSFIGQSITAASGDTIQFSVKNGNSNSTSARIFIDYNLDASFSTSSPELVWTSPTTTASAVVSDYFIIPSGLSAGLYRIRVTGDFGGNASGNPCTLNYGETEDYSLIVTSSSKDGIALGHVAPASFVTGNNTISFAVVNLSDSAIHDLDIGYQLDANSAVTENLSGLSIAAGTIDTVTFSTALNISSAGNYSLKVWLNNLNGGGTVSASDDTLCRSFIVCTSPLSGTYTIDTTGSGSTNFLTFTEAVAALANCGISGPVTFNVAAATFNEQISILPVSGISSTNTVSFVGVDTASTVLTFAGTTSAPYTVRVNGAKYINFSNMAIKSSATTAGWILNFLNARNCNVNKCLLEFTGSARTSNANNLACVVINGSQTTMNSQTANGSTDSINIDSSALNYGYYNTYMYLGGGVNNAIMHFRGNNFHNAYYTSIYIWLAAPLCHKILNNHFSLRSGASNQFAIWSWASAASSSSLYSEIANNVFTNLNGYGIATTYSGGNGGSKGLIYNNLFGGNTRGATRYISGAGAACCAFNGWNIYHNTIYMDCNTGVSIGFDLGGNSSGNTVSVKNNIFYNASTSANNVGISATNSSAIGTVDYNNFYTAYSGGTLAAIGGVNYTANSIAAAYPNGGGANSISRDVDFVSSTDYHHTTGCMSGETNLGVTLDFDGVTRAVPPGLGAFEPSGVPAVDVGIAQIIAPSFPVTAGSQPLTALVKNYGSDSLSSIKVYAIVNSVLDSETFNFSPALYQCDTASVTFTNNVSITSGFNTIKVYTALAGDSAATNDTAQNNYCVAMSGSYTINSGAAASSTNFTSFGAAVNQLVCGGISAAVDFTVSGNTYTEQVSIPPIVGTSSTNTITFTGAGVSSTVLTYGGSSTNPHTLRLAGCQYVSFRKMNIQATDGSYGWAVSLMNSKHNNISACKIECSGSASTSTSANIAAVVINNSSSNMYSTGNNDSNYIDSNTIISGYYGIANYTSTNTSTNYFRNNVISNAYMSSIYCQNNSVVKILNNTISNRSSNGSSRGINLINLFATSGQANKYIEIIGNYIDQVGQYGIFLQSCYGGTNSGKGMIVNNMIGGTFYGSNTNYGIHFSYCDQWNIYHNSISMAATSGASNRGIYITGGSPYKNDIVNNSISIDDATASGALCLEVTGSTYVNYADYNNYYNASTTDLLVIAGTTYDNTNYAAGYPSGGGANSIDGNPGYSSANDLHATGSQLDDKADASIGITDDIDGDTRSTATPDIGADEYSSITRQDLAVTSLVAPQNVSCLGGFNQTITAIIKNVGIDTVDLSNDTAWVSADVVDPNSNTITYGTIMITGKTFYPGDTMLVNITNTFDMSDLGNYNIKPIVTWANDSNQTNNSLKNQNFTGEAPSVRLSISKTSICNGDTVWMNVGASKNVTDYLWYENGNATANIDSVNFVVSAGTYFCLMANNSGCLVSTDTITISSGSTPSASFTASQTTFCAGDSAKLSASYNSANTYQWIKNNNTIQGASDSIYYAGTSGDYNLKVTETASGCSSMATSVSITVIAAPAADITFLGAPLRCAGDSLKLSSNPASGLTYQWSMNGSAISGAIDSIYYVTASGDYQVEITNSNGCKTTSTSTTVTIDPLPNNSVNITGNTTACGSDSVWLDATQNANYTYQWMNSGVDINGATNSQLIVTANGDYTVKVTNNNGCSNISSNINVTYKLKPTVPVLLGNSATKVCPNDSTRISIMAQDTGVFTYQWKLNGSNISGAVDSFVYVSAAGTYTAEVINNGGCATAAATNIDVTMYTAPTPSLTAGGNTAICAGDSVRLDVSNASGITSTSWTLNGGSLSNTGITIYATTAGAYISTIKDLNGCAGSTAAVNVTVNPLPVPVITDITGSSQLTTGSYSTYQWYLGGTAISGATTQTIRIFSNGDYTVEVTDANGCKGKSAVNTVTWYVGIASAEVQSAISVYPNPSHDVFNVELPTGLESARILISDITGKQISTEAVRVNKNVYTLDMTNQSAGVYIMSFSKNDQVYQVRLIKY